MNSTGTYGFPVRAIYLVWLGLPIAIRPVPELTPPIVTPAPKCAVSFGCARMTVARANFFPCGPRADLNGGHAVHVCAIAESAI